VYSKLKLLDRVCKTDLNFEEPNITCFEFADRKQPQQIFLKIGPLLTTNDIGICQN